MKKSRKITAVILCVILIIMNCCTVAVFATGSQNDTSDTPDTYSSDVLSEDEIMDLLSDYCGDEEDIEYFMTEMWGTIVICSICLLLFIPAVVTAIVFIVLYVKTNKKVKNYKMYGAPFMVGGAMPTSPNGNYIPQMNQPNTQNGDINANEYTNTNAYMNNAVNLTQNGDSQNTAMNNIEGGGNQ